MKQLEIGSHIAIVDDEHYDEIVKLKWSVVRRSDKQPYYAVSHTRRFGGKEIRMHRMVFFHLAGKMGFSGLHIDHINGNSLDNRLCNLRLATASQNNANKWKPKRETQSKYKGVYCSRNRKRWKAGITVNDKPRGLGTFDTEEEAARAYDIAAIEAFGEFARTNAAEFGLRRS